MLQNIHSPARKSDPTSLNLRPTVLKLKKINTFAGISIAP